jgi:hypothetical protein
MSSKTSSDCGRSSLKFLSVSRRPFGIELQSENAFGQESQRTQFLRILPPVPAAKAAVSAVNLDVINPDQQLACNELVASAST